MRIRCDTTVAQRRLLSLIRGGNESHRHRILNASNFSLIREKKKERKEHKTRAS